VPAWILGLWMQVKINGKPEEIQPATLTSLLQSKAIDAHMVTVELNGKMTDRAQWDQTEIRSGDEIEFLYFMGGGAI